jgi:hypothetical protein
MSADFVIRECSVHFGDGVLGHVAADTGGFLARTANPAWMIVTWFRGTSDYMTA